MTPADAARVQYGRGTYALSLAELACMTGHPDHVAVCARLSEAGIGVGRYAADVVMELRTMLQRRAEEETR